MPFEFAARRRRRDDRELKLAAQYPAPWARPSLSPRCISCSRRSFGTSVLWPSGLEPCHLGRAPRQSQAAAFKLSAGAGQGRRRRRAGRPSGDRGRDHWQQAAGPCSAVLQVYVQSDHNSDPPVADSANPRPAGPGCECPGQPECRARACGQAAGHGPDCSRPGRPGPNQ